MKIDTLEVDYDEWEIHKESDISYEYIHYPPSICGEDSQEKITVTLQEDGTYKFDAQEYMEIYGSGGWNRWTDYKDELKDTILKDAMMRINPK